MDTTIVFINYIINEDGEQIFDIPNNDFECCERGFRGLTLEEVFLKIINSRIIQKIVPTESCEFERFTATCTGYHVNHNYAEEFRHRLNEIIFQSEEYTACQCNKKYTIKFVGDEPDLLEIKEPVVDY